ncbi:MAG: choice-of-anchor J domain-containing protein [Planctomycetes bacterium]|nr:choice-of-anchor J domain-containing protein [Planctomycetota bacterium]
MQPILLLPLSLALPVLAAGAPAQSSGLSPSAAPSNRAVFLTEDFSGGLVPPVGWVEGNNGNSLGWELEAAGLGVLLGSDHAFHDDFTGYNDNYLMSPAMDFTGAAAVFAYCDQGVTYASWRDHHYVDISLDGGLTFINVADDLAVDGYSVLNVDLGAYAGTNGVNVSYHYTGDYASEWELDNLVVDDIGPPPPPPAWPNLPSAFMPAAGYADDFESYGGVVPAHFGVNELAAATGLPDPEAYCDIAGGSGLGAYSGTACLEMGLDPLSNNYHDVRNGLIIGLNGAGAGVLDLDFQALDHGEETDTWDGVWVSDDGIFWHQAYGPWTPLLTTWQAVAGVNLDGAGANTSGDFYLLFAQDDNFPYGYLDGLGVDDINITSTAPGPVLTVTNLIGNQTATMTVTGATANGCVIFGESCAGNGPTSTPYGDLMLSPIIYYRGVKADAFGTSSVSHFVPGSKTGKTLHFHAFDQVSLTFTNALSIVVG